VGTLFLHHRQLAAVSGVGGARLDLSATEALTALVDLNLGNGA
jgi:hypothetical protein